MKRTQIEMLSDFMTGLNTSIDACSQMVACHRLDPKWIAMRDLLNVIKDNLGGIVTRGMSNGTR